MLQTFSVAWFVLVGAVVLTMLAAAGYVWYKIPRCLAEQQSFTEPQISDDESKKRTILGQIFGMPAIAFGVVTALVALFSGIQTYRDSLDNNARQDQIQEMQQSVTYNTLFHDGIGLLL